MNLSKRKRGSKVWNEEHPYCFIIYFYIEALRTRQLEQEVGMKTDNSKEMSNNSDLKQ